MSGKKLQNAALKLMRAASGLLLSVLDAGYHDDIEIATGYTDVIHRLVGAHLSYRGYTVLIHANADTHHTLDDVMSAMDDYRVAVEMTQTEAERAIVEAIHHTTYEMCNELALGGIYE